MITSMNLTDDVASLILQARRGSQEAFGELVRAHQQLVRSFLSRYLQSTAAIDDLAQETFLVAYRQLDEYRGDASFQSWLLGIARNQALMFIRSEVRRREREKRVAEATLLQWQSNELLHHDETNDEEATLEALRDCIEHLPPVSRQVLDGFYFQSESTEQLSRRLNKKCGAIRMMLLRIRKSLGNCVRGKLGRRDQL